MPRCRGVPAGQAVTHGREGHAHIVANEDFLHAAKLKNEIAVTEAKRIADEAAVAAVEAADADESDDDQEEFAALTAEVKALKEELSEKDLEINLLKEQLAAAATAIFERDQENATLKKELTAITNDSLSAKGLDEVAQREAATRAVRAQREEKAVELEPIAGVASQPFVFGDQMLKIVSRKGASLVGFSKENTRAQEHRKTAADRVERKLNKEELGSLKECNGHETLFFLLPDGAKLPWLVMNGDRPITKERIENAKEMGLKGYFDINIVK